MTASSSITPKPTLAYYKAGVSWAGRDFTVIPGGVDKRPLVKWKRFVRPEQQVPSRQDRVGFRVKGLDHQVSPLLLLDSPSSEALCLCVIDVDEMSAKRDVITWIKEKGYSAPLVVKTGRDGGGEHLYFLREANSAGSYRSGQAKVFGKTKGKYRVDLKARNSYAVCPGAVHITGRTYEASLNGQPVECIEDVLSQLPTMKLSDWHELSARVAGESPDEAEYVTSDAKWLSVIENGAERQPCPWCQRGGDRVLHWKGGAAHCYFEQKTRKVQTKYQKALEQVDAALSDLPDGPQDDDTLSPLQEALLDMERALPEPRLAVELFPEDDPLAEWSGEALKAAVLAAKMAVYDVPLRCKERGLGAIVATGQKLIKTETSCWSYACKTCGPILRKCLKISLVTAMARRGAEPSKVYVFEADYTDPKKFNTTVKQRLTAWARKVAKEAEDERDEELERPELPPFEWCAIQATPGTAYVMMWGDVSPKEIERSSPVSGTLTQMVDYVFNRVDQDEWDAHNKKLREEYEKDNDGETKHFRTVYMLAPRFMKGLVNDLKNFLTGRKRSGLENGRGLAKRVHEWDKDTDPNNCKPDKRKPGADFAFLPTYHVKAFIKYAEDKLMTTLDFQVDHATGFGTTQSARLPCKAAPLVREFVADNPHLHAHKKSKVAALALVDDDLDLYLGE